MGAEGAVNVVCRTQMANAEDPAARREELTQMYKDTFSTPFMAASRGLVDDIIDPADTRANVAMALEVLANKRETRPFKKHGLTPM